MQYEKDNTEAATLEYYASQLNKNLENRMKELTRRINKIHTSSISGLHTRSDEVHNEKKDREYVFESRRIISRREVYRTFEDDARVIEQAHLKIIGLSLGQLILSIFRKECKPYLFMYL
jgi:hypothetical protein